MDRWSMPTAIHAAAGCLAALPGVAPDPLVLVDSRLPQHPELSRGTVVGLDASDFNDALRAARDALAAHPGRPVVAAGGGTVLDAVRLAELARRSPAFAGALAGAGPGVFVWPSVDSSPVVAVPTTIGTAAEVSPVALVPGSPATMVVSPALRCRAAFLDPHMTASLGRDRQGAGLVEPFARAVVPAITSVPLALQDQLAGAHARVLLDLGRELALGRVDDSWLLSAALTSASTHTSFLSLGRPPAGHVLWPFATELMRLTGVDKAAALTVLLPAWLDLVGEGLLGPQFGTGARVRQILGERHRVREWLSEIGLPAGPVAVDAHLLAAQVREVWQGPLFLRGVADRDILAIAEAVAG